jgi:ABC-type antimicrobial peptide transport system ATPase subunit
MVFQDPSASLNPRRRVGNLVAEPLRIHSKLSSSEINKRVAELFDLVGLLPDHVMRHPHDMIRRTAPTCRHRSGHCIEPRSRRGAQIVNLLADL